MHLASAEAPVSRIGSVHGRISSRPSAFDRLTKPLEGQYDKATIGPRQEMETTNHALLHQNTNRDAGLVEIGPSNGRQLASIIAPLACSD